VSVRIAEIDAATADLRDPQMTGLREHATEPPGRGLPP
jgi:hypothetical protein